MCEAVSGMLDKAMSGRRTVRLQNEQDAILKLLPFLNEALSVSQVKDLRIGCYMLLTIMAAKGRLGDHFLSPMMEAVALGVTSETVVPSLVCLSILAQHREAKQLPSRLTRQLLKFDNLAEKLGEISRDRRVDRLVNGLCLALVHRIKTKSDVTGLPFIIEIAEKNLLQNDQMKVITKALVLAAYQVDDKDEAASTLRSSMANTLIHLTQISGPPGEVVRLALQETEVDIDDLELKLHAAIRPFEIQTGSSDTIEAVIATQDNHEQGKTPFSLLARRLPQSSTDVTLLGGNTPEYFHDLLNGFIVASARTSDLEAFDTLPLLRREAALIDPYYLSFYMRLWCSNIPVMARVAALGMACRFVASTTDKAVDFQALLPYLIAALSDPAERVRRAAAAFCVQTSQQYAQHPNTKPTDVNIWGKSLIYAQGESFHKIKTLQREVASRFVDEVILPSLEECILDNNRIAIVIATAINSSHAATESPKKPDSTRLPQVARAGLMSFLAGHAVCTPLLLVKLKILRALNGVQSVSSSSRTRFLLPVLQQWATLPLAQAKEQCTVENIDLDDCNHAFVTAIVPQDKEGLDFMTSILRGVEAIERHDLLNAVFKRLKIVWQSMKIDAQLTLGETLLGLSQSPDITGYAKITAELAADLLQTVTLPTELLRVFLSRLSSTTHLLEKPRAAKRRRTSHGEAIRLSLQDNSDVTSSLGLFTFVLQLIDGARPEAHSDLLGGLFDTLSELQRLKSHVSSELAYLQGLVLSSLRAIISSTSPDSRSDFDGSSIRVDLVVDCVQKTSSSQVQNSALLLIASLATVAPEMVLHSVMPIFTFIGNSVLIQNDDYSAHVIDRTIKEIIPPLIASLRTESSDVALGASELLLSFVAAYEHIPHHRRKNLFVLLVQTLGPEDFLSPLLAMLVDKHGVNAQIKEFIRDVASSFDAAVQMHTVLKSIDLCVDILQPKSVYAAVLLGSGDSTTSIPHATALRQLEILPTILSNPRLVSQTSKQLLRDEMDAANLRDLYSSMLERVLSFAETVRNQSALHTACGDVLQSLLSLLPVEEFVKSMDGLLDRVDNDALRRKVLRSLEVRLDSETQYDLQSRNAMLGFLPHLTSIIRDSSDLLYKYTAVSCIDKIAEKYGKKDLEAVAGAAEMIASQHCLGQADERLRLLALLCLTSITEILKEGIVSVLPTAIPQCLGYLSTIAKSSTSGSSDSKLHDAGFSFLSAQMQYIPYMITGSILNDILDVSTLLAGADLDTSSHRTRKHCLTMAAKQVDAKIMFTSLLKAYDSVVKSGAEVRSYALSRNLN